MIVIFVEWNVNAKSKVLFWLFLFADLTPDELRILADIRRRKEKLLLEIQQLQEEIDAVSRDISTQPSTTSLTTVATSCPSSVSNATSASNNTEETTSVGSDGCNNSRTASDNIKLMSLGCKKFNMDPKKGIEFLLNNSLLQPNAEDVAQVSIANYYRCFCNSIRFKK